MPTSGSCLRTPMCARRPPSPVKLRRTGRPAHPDAMPLRFTVQTAGDTASPSRGGSRPSWPAAMPSQQMRGRGECRVKASPMARLRKKCRRQVPQVQPVNRHSPRAGLNAYTRSPRGPASIAPVAYAMRKHRRLLGLSSGRPGPHDFTSASMSFVGMIQSRCDPTRPAHPHLAYRDDRAYAPLGEAGCGE